MVVDRVYIFFSPENFSSLGSPPNYVSMLCIQLKFSFVVQLLFDACISTTALQFATEERKIHMKIVLRSIGVYEITKDTSPTQTILDLKHQLSGEYELGSLWLCHKGKMLEDGKTFQELGFADNEVLIIVGKNLSVSKPHAQASASPPRVALPLPTAVGAPVGSAVDPELVDSIVMMGFKDRAQVTLALRAAYMNPDRAVEYLCNGIPSGRANPTSVA